jgi:hypothetical protein
MSVVCIPRQDPEEGPFNAVADKYYVQIRGIHGEDTKTV